MPDEADALNAVLRLLQGFTIANGGRKYLEDGSSEELKARAALVRLLEGDDPVPRAVRYQLAALFDPNTKLPWEERRLVFEFKNSGRRKSEMAIKRLWEIYHRNKAGEGVTAIVREIAERDGVEDNSLMKSWTQFKKFDLPLLEGIISAPPTGGYK
jgi:hypothetical protein